LLCLAVRVPALRALGVEREPEIAEVARQNMAANQFAAIEIRTGDVTADPLPGADHVFANPPYHSETGTLPGDKVRAVAKHAAAGLITSWIRALAVPLRRHGTLTMVLAATALPEAIAGLQAVDCPASAALALWPKPGRAAKLVLLQGVRQGKGPFRLLPGLTLHRPDGGFTEEAEAVLRYGANLALSGNRELPRHRDSV